MTIWGKIIGSATGFAFGGPIGALLGGAAGHALDKLKTKQKLPAAAPGGEHNTRQTALHDTSAEFPNSNSRMITPSLLGPCVRKKKAMSS